MLVKASVTDSKNVSSSMKQQVENEAEKEPFPGEPTSFHLPLLRSSLETVMSVDLNRPQATSEALTQIVFLIKTDKRYFQN